MCQNRTCLCWPKRLASKDIRLDPEMLREHYLPIMHWFSYRISVARFYMEQLSMTKTTQRRKGFIWLTVQGYSLSL